MLVTPTFKSTLARASDNCSVLSVTFLSLVAACFSDGVEFLLFSVGGLKGGKLCKRNVHMARGISEQDKKSQLQCCQTLIKQEFVQEFYDEMYNTKRKHSVIKL